MTLATDRVEVVTEGSKDAPKEALSYEQARDKLAAVVKRLEAGGLTLEQSLELWERGERLAAVCEGWLGRRGGPPPGGPGKAGRLRPARRGGRRALLTSARPVCLPFCWASG